MVFLRRHRLPRNFPAAEHERMRIRLGGSTVFFARRVHSVFSIEDNASWHELVSNRLKEKSLNNVTMKLCPFDFKNPDGL